MSSPILTLPPELLRAIFLARHRSQPDSSSPPCFAISHVCSAWRVIALDISELWSSIVVREFGATTLHRISEYIRRSGTHPLEVNISIAAPLDILFASECVPEIGRLLSDPSHRIQAFSCQQLPLTLLEALVVTTFTRRVDFRALKTLLLYPSEGGEELPSEAFCSSLSWNSFPSLAHLALAYLPLQLCSSLSRGHLLTLSLTHDAYPEALRDGILAVLANCPRLQHLTIQRYATLGSIPEEVFEPPTRSAVIPLHDLETLSLAYLSRDCTWFFLSTLSYPENTTVGLLSHLDWPVPHEITSTAFRNLIRRVDDVGLFLVYKEDDFIQDTYDCTVLLECADSLGRNVLSVGWKRSLVLPAGETPPLQVHTSDIPPESLHFPNAQSAYVRLRIADGVPMFNRDHWMDVLSGLPELRELYVTFECAGLYRSWPGSELCYALATPPPEGYAHDEWCPQLEYVALCFSPRSYAESEWCAQSITRYLGRRPLREIGVDPLTQLCLLQYGWGKRATVWDDRIRFRHPGLQ